MDKQYHPTEIEEKWAKVWSERKVKNESSTESFSQVIPPPNVTGTLHMGHSFQYAIMDFYLGRVILFIHVPRIFLF